MRDFVDAVAGGQLGDLGDDIHRVWYHPRSARATAWDVSHPEHDSIAAADAASVAGIYPSRDVDFSLEFAPVVSGRALADDDLRFQFRELGLAYEFVPPRRFGDPSLFLDFRATRRWVRARVARLAAERDGSETTSDEGTVSVLNAFAYTCGVGVAAAAGGAGRVLNTDHSATYLDVGFTNAELNGFERFPKGAFDAYCEDYYPAARLLAGLSMPGRRTKGGGRGGRGGRRGRGGRGGRGGESGASSKKASSDRRPPESFDVVVLDPPTLTKTAYGAVDIVNDYQSLAKPAALCVTPGGVLVATNHSADVALDDWLEIVERCCAKAGCAVASTEIIAPDDDDDDHPAMEDGKRPLKVAAFTLE